MIPEGLYLQRTRYLQKHEENITFDKYIVVTMNIYTSICKRQSYLRHFLRTQLKKLSFSNIKLLRLIAKI